MAFKLNRGCWVESFGDRILHNATVKDEACSYGAAHSAGAEGGLSTERAGRTTLQERIHLALDVFSVIGPAIQEDRRIQNLLFQLKEDLAASHTAMQEFGIIKACALCDETAPEGSCCAHGLEEKYDSILILINLLMGVNLLKTRDIPGSCHFLGSYGCTLRVRHMLCIDYLCPELETELGKERLFSIQATSGREIQTSFLLEEAVKDLCQRYFFRNRSMNSSRSFLSPSA